MKRTFKKVVLFAAAALTAFALAACSETGGARASATAIGAGHGGYPGTTVIEVTVIVDGAGQPVKVQFDELFSVFDAATRAAASADTKELTVVGGNGRAAKVNLTKVLQIDGKFFELDFTAPDANGESTVEYKGVDTGAGFNDGKDIIAYTTSDPAGIEWYYNAVVNKKAFYAKENAGVYEATATPFTTVNGSIRKRYSTYWTTGLAQFSGLGIKGNWEALENYLLTYGFDGVTNAGAVVNPGGDKLYVEINGTVTGATMSPDAPQYLKVAKDAYDKAVAKLNA
jgi:hypothetical protein